MDFLFTFRDGSKALAHYGVKGMKWGVHKFGEDIAAAGGGMLEDAAIDLFGTEEDRQNRNERKAAEEARRNETIEIPNWQYGIHDQWKDATGGEIPKTVNVSSVNDYHAEKEYEFVRRQKMVEGLDSGNEEEIKKNTETEIAWREEGRQKYIKTGDPKYYMQFKGLRLLGRTSPDTSTYHDTPQAIAEKKQREIVNKKKQQEKIAKARKQFETARNGQTNIREKLFGNRRSNPLLKSVKRSQTGGSKGGKF